MLPDHLFADGRAPSDVDDQTSHQVAQIVLIEVFVVSGLLSPFLMVLIILPLTFVLSRFVVQRY